MIWHHLEKPHRTGAAARIRVAAGFDHHHRRHQVGVETRRGSPGLDGIIPELDLGGKNRRDRARLSRGKCCLVRRNACRSVVGLLRGGRQSGCGTSGSEPEQRQQEPDPKYCQGREDESRKTTALWQGGCFFLGGDRKGMIHPGNLKRSYEWRGPSTYSASRTGLALTDTL